jgi:hypothetical protein
VSEGLQDQSDDCHDRLNDAELQRCLLAEAQEADGVLATRKTAGAVEPAVTVQKKHTNQCDKAQNKKGAYWIGFPLISDMIALSPPRYS